MKNPTKSFLVLFAWFCAVWAMPPLMLAQMPVELGIQLYAGLAVQGTVGRVYSIEYLTDLSATNNVDAWRSLDYLQLPATTFRWIDKSPATIGRRFYRAVEFVAPTNLVFIPPGTFRMGSPTNEPLQTEGPQVSVTISRGFWMAKHEVTQGDYLAVMGINPSYFNHGYADNLTRPVESVRWTDATNYCGQLTLREQAAGRIKADCVYRLPTQAEWEYACRAWTSTRFSFGDDPTGADSPNYAWFLENSENETHPVGQKWPNPWGLYDMHGNVSEFCQDWPWLSGYPEGIAIDPQGRPDPGVATLSRGGNWSAFSQSGRSAARNYSQGVNSANTAVGFRVVFSPQQP